MNKKELEDHWANTKEYKSPGYEGFKTHRRIALANLIVEKNPKKVLEIGTLGGYNLREINKLDPSIELVGFDINEEALHYAVQKCPSIRPVHGSAHRLREHFCENEFDLIFTAGVMIHIPNADAPAMAANIATIASDCVVHAEHHGPVAEKVRFKRMRWVHNFEELYDSHETKIFPAWDASCGFEDIIDIKLNKKDIK